MISEQDILEVCCGYVRQLVVDADIAIQVLSAVSRDDFPLPCVLLVIGNIICHDQDYTIVWKSAIFEDFAYMQRIRLAAAVCPSFRCCYNNRPLGFEIFVIDVRIYERLQAGTWLTFRSYPSL